jgi:hypothetical protein
MKLQKSSKFFVTLILVYSFLFNALPRVNACGPEYLAPIFDYNNVAEKPWTDFANGKLGIVKPTYHRNVLFGAYRYLKGGGFSADEQKALIEVWDADFNNKPYDDNDVTNAVKNWVKTRSSAVKNEEKIPQIYVEREYGGYDYFPNCTKNAFEVASETLKNRSSNEEKDVQEWIHGQDKVFSNCASGSEIPQEIGQDSPQWLQKDRKYQIAAALFYSTKYSDARQKFTEIAEDSDSPWKETADFLVARTLIREASLKTTNADGEEKDNPAAKELYIQAEQQLNLVISRSPKYSESAQKLQNLIKYRIYPETRVRELAQSLEANKQGVEMRQDLIDYTWLLDKLEAKALRDEEEKKKADDEKDNKINSNNLVISNLKLAPINSNSTNEIDEITVKNEVDTILKKRGYNNVITNIDNHKIILTGFVPKGKMQEVQILASETGKMPVTVTYLTEKNESIENSSAASSNQGRYYGDEKTSLSILPDYLRDDELSDWLFTYQTEGDEAYLHSLEKFQQTTSDLWLMTAISKANPNSKDLKILLREANKMNRNSVAYPTIAYHQARILLAQNKQVEAKKLIDDILNSGLDLPISTRNQFMEMRMKLADTLADFIKYSLKKPFAFGYDYDYTDSQTITDMIAQRKAEWNAEDYKDTSKADWDEQIDKEFASELTWEKRLFLDDKSVQIINENFSSELLLEMLKDENLPDYWKNRLIPVIWTRSYLIKDEKTALQIASEVVRVKPETEKPMQVYVNAKTPAERDLAGLDLIIKIRDLTPYLESGFEKQYMDDFDSWTDERWWCEGYDGSYDENYENKIPTFKPSFITPQQTAKAKLERTKLLAIKDATSYLNKRVFAWNKIAPTDKRLPEALYVIYSINHWTKYGCGDYQDSARERAEAILRAKFPKNKWTLKMIEDKKAEENNAN